MSDALETEAVVQCDRMHDRLEFVKAIGPFAQNVEEQINFAG